MATILTSGGMAMVHIATPAVPPAKMIALKLRSVEPAGVNHFFVIS
jgi:hypothetical protein